MALQGEQSIYYDWTIVHYVVTYEPFTHGGVMSVDIPVNIRVRRVRLSAGGGDRYTWLMQRNIAYTGHGQWSGPLKHCGCPNLETVPLYGGSIYTRLSTFRWT